MCKYLSEVRGCRGAFKGRRCGVKSTHDVEVGDFQLSKLELAVPVPYWLVNHKTDLGDYVRAFHIRGAVYQPEPVYAMLSHPVVLLTDKQLFTDFPVPVNH